MDTVTHALLPVIIAGLAKQKTERFGRWAFVGIGFAGALPDLLNPHLSLEARMASWSHGVPFWLAISILWIDIAVSSRGRFTIRLALWFSGAYLLHMLCDAISGGLNFLQPFGIWIWGDYWVDPIWWVPLDVICVLSCYFMFRFAPMVKARKTKCSPLQ